MAISTNIPVLLMTGFVVQDHTHTHTHTHTKLLKITIPSQFVSMQSYPHTNATRMQSQIHGLPSRLAVPHCTYVCMCLWVYLDLFSLWISDFALFFFLCTHVGSVLEILRFVLCMSFACKCMCATAFIQRWQAVLNQVRLPDTWFTAALFLSLSLVF